MALNCSSEIKVVIVQIVCVVEIQSESAWAFTNITSGNTCHVKFHASEASGSEEEDFNIFLCIFWFKPRIPWGGSILDPGATIGIDKVKHHKAMLHTKFQAVGEEDF